MVHLNKERLHNIFPHKIHIKMLRPFQILAKYDNNVYQKELRTNIGLSPVFNIVNLIRYKGTTPYFDQILKEVIQDVEYLDLTPPLPKGANKVLDSRAYKKTRTATYWEHLAKWHGK